MARSIHQLPRLAASRMYFLASPREGTWVAAWHFAGFMRPLRMVPGPVHLSPPSLFPLWYAFFPLLLLSSLSSPRPRLRAFCGVAITRQSPLPFGPLIDARCVGTGVPGSRLNRLRPYPHAVGLLLLPHAEKTRVQSFVNRPDCTAQRRRVSLGAQPRIHGNESAPQVSYFV